MDSDIARISELVVATCTLADRCAQAPDDAVAVVGLAAVQEDLLAALENVTDPAAVDDARGAVLLIDTLLAHADDARHAASLPAAS